MTKTKPVCLHCGLTESLLWRMVEVPTGGQREICNDCHVAEEERKEALGGQVPMQEEPPTVDGKKDKENNGVGGEESQAGNNKSTRKSTRATRYKVKTPAAGGKPGGTKGRGRRSLFKRLPMKAPTTTATIVSSDTIFYKGFYMQVGDIVSMVDVEGDTYYAQVRGFLTDEYCEKSAVVTWLLPTKASPPPNQAFDPATYIIGPEEDLPRKLECMEFVMHAPSDYYKDSTNPYPPVQSDVITKNYNGFIWTSLEMQLR